MRQFRLYGITLLIALLVSIYTMTNAGRFHIVDEVSLFAVTESLAVRGEVDTNAIAWTQWVNSPGEVLGAFGPDGEVYSKKGPAPAFLAVPWYMVLRFFGLLDFTVGLVQSTLLWNGVVTALTAALLWLTAIRLGYGDRTGMGLGLLFGLATIAWPYANQFFGEPLSALSLLLAFYGICSWHRTRRTGWMLAGGIGAGLAVATVAAHTLLIAVLGLHALAGWWLAPASLDAGVSRGSASRLVAGLAAFLAPLLVAGALLMWYNGLRFGSPFDTGYHFDSGEGFTTPFRQGFWGLMISPYRGLFWHTPLFLASIVGFRSFFRRARFEAITIAAMSVILVGLYSLWWMWWGGFAWGPRFLVPLTPFWVLLTASLVETVLGDYSVETPKAWRAESRWQQVKAIGRSWGASGVALILLGGVSLLVQISAVTVNYVNYEIELRALYPTNWEDPLEFGPPAQAVGAFLDSPVFGQWKLMADGLFINSDLAWLWPSGNVQWLVVLIGCAVLLTLTAALALWWVTSRRPGRDNVPSTPVWFLLAALPLLLMTVWSGEVSRSPHYGEPHVGYRAVVEQICAGANANDAVVTVAPFTYQIPMNWLPATCRSGLPVYGYAKDSFQHPEAQLVLDRLQSKYNRIWMVTGGLPVNDPENSLERWLADAAYKADDHWQEDYRLVQYATPRLLDGAGFSALGVPLMDDNGQQVTILAMRAPASIMAGGALPVEIYYQLNAPPNADLRWFVQLISPEGYATALVDTAPADGYIPFTALPLGEELNERAGLLIPATAEPGTYQLIAGLYNPNAEGAPRLRAPDGSDFVELGKIDIDRN